MSLKEGDQVLVMFPSLKVEGEVVFAMFASLKVETRVVIVDLPLVYEFSYVFSYDIRDLTLEREVDFDLDLVPGTRRVSMATYRMSALVLNELKSQLKELMERNLLNIMYLCEEHQCFW